MLAAIYVEQKERQYRGYVTDVLRLIGENVAAVGRGSYIPARWIDLSEDKKQVEENADDIARGVIKRASLLVKGGNDGRPSI